MAVALQTICGEMEIVLNHNANGIDGNSKQDLLKRIALWKRDLEERLRPA